MKKFTCLLVALLAINSVYTAACSTTAGENSQFAAVLMASYTYTSPAAALAAADFTTTAAGVATGAAVCNSAMTCIVTGSVAKVQNWYNDRLGKVATAFTTFVTNFAPVGKRFAKIFEMTYDSTTLEGIATPNVGGYSGTEAKTLLLKWTKAADVDTAFTAFKSGAVGCFNYIAQAYQNIICQGIGATTNDVAPFANAAAAANANGIPITTAGATALVGACGKVWGFMNRVAVAAVAAGAYNKAKSGTTYTYAAPTTLTNAFDYKDTSITTTNLLKIDNCIDPTVTATCDAASQAAMVGAFLMPFADNPLAIVAKWGFGTDTLAATAFPAASRRQLAVSAPNTCVLSVASSGTVDITLTAAANQITLPTSSPTSFTTTITNAWSSGYVAASSGSNGSNGSSSSSSTKSNANVLIGSVLSFLAIALLN